MSYCGKNCETCNFKEELSCKGCDPNLDESCEIVRCVKYEVTRVDSCFNCKNRFSCEKYAIRNIVPQERRKEKEINDSKKAFMSSHGSKIRTAFGVLFIITLLYLLIGYITKIPAIKNNSTLYIVISVISPFLTLSKGLVLLKLASYKMFYLKVAILYILDAVATVALLFIGNETISFGLALLLLVIEIYVRLAELKAHSELVFDFDPGLVGTWLGIRKMYLVGLLLIMVTPVVALLFNSIFMVGFYIIAMVIGTILTIVATIRILSAYLKTKQLFS